MKGWNLSRFTGKGSYQARIQIRSVTDWSRLSGTAVNFPLLSCSGFWGTLCLHLQGISFFLWRNSPTRSWAHVWLRFLDYTHRRTTLGRTALDEGSARHRDIYLTTHNIRNRQTSMPPSGFQPAIPTRERPQTYAFDSAVKGICNFMVCVDKPTILNNITRKTVI